jgi:hypothetical protein
LKVDYDEGIRGELQQLLRDGGNFVHLWAV